MVLPLMAGAAKDVKVPPATGTTVLVSAILINSRSKARAVKGIATTTAAASRAGTDLRNCD